MSNTLFTVLRVLLGILTALTALSMIGLLIFAIVNAYWLLMVTAILIGAVLVYFTYLDIKILIAKRAENNSSDATTNK